MIDFSFNKKILVAIKGFTLIEALVAISILMIAIASPIMLAQKGLSSSILSRDQMIASFLVQDGIEAIKNMRDFTAINQVATDTPTINPTKDWLFGLREKCVCDESLSNCDLSLDNAKYCNFDSTVDLTDDLKIFSSDIPGSDIMYMDFNTDGDGNSLFKKYVVGGLATSKTKFSRRINIKENLYDLETKGHSHETELKVRVFWDSPYGIQNIEIKTFMYNFESALI
jgi:hypothetical protein